MVIDRSAQNFLKSAGRRLLQSTVKFGSGAGPKLVSVCNILNEVRVTNVLPSTPIPPILSVTQVGSPEKSSLYSLVRINFTILSFITKWSISSCAPLSSKTPRSMSRVI